MCVVVLVVRESLLALAKYIHLYTYYIDIDMEFGGGGGAGDHHDASSEGRRKKRYHRHTAHQIQRLEG